MKPDLHTHSTASDGVLSPAELCRRAAEAGITLMALTDHDTFDGVRSLGETPIPVLQGTELSMADREGMHLLCYGLPEESPLHEKVRELSRQRLGRFDRMLELLEKAGMPLDRAALTADPSVSLGRPHIARAMIGAGYVKNMQEAFQRYLGEGKPFYVPAERMTLREALPLARESGFVPVLAHPFEMGMSVHTLAMLIPGWKQQGLMGVEVYHPSARSKGYRQLELLARENGLLVTGGSDFHMDHDKHGTLGEVPEEWTCREEDVQALLSAMERAERDFRNQQNHQTEEQKGG